MPAVTELNPGNFTDFANQDRFILILSKSDCRACRSWQQELEAAGEVEELSSFPIGKLNLDQPGFSTFKRNNSWLQDVGDLPHTAIYVEGLPKKTFSGSGLNRLINRVQRLATPA